MLFVCLLSHNIHICIFFCRLLNFFWRSLEYFDEMQTKQGWIDETLPNTSSDVIVEDLFILYDNKTSINTLFMARKTFPSAIRRAFLSQGYKLWGDESFGLNLKITLKTNQKKVYNLWKALKKALLINWCDKKSISELLKRLKGDRQSFVQFASSPLPKMLFKVITVIYVGLFLSGSCNACFNPEVADLIMLNFYTT